MMTICWIQHASEYPLVEKIAEALKKREVKSIFVCKTLGVHEQYLKDGYESYYISEIFKPSSDKLSPEELEALDFKYGPRAIKGASHSDVHFNYLFGDNQEIQEQLAGQAYKFWEKFITEHQVDYFLCRDIASFAARSAYNFARYHNIPLAQLAMGPGPEYFILSDFGPASVWSELLEKIKIGFKPLTLEQKSEIFAFIKQRLPKVSDKMALRFVPVSLFKSLKKIMGTFLRDTASARSKDPIKIGALHHSRKFLIKRLYWKYLSKNFFKYDSLREEKFVYFPFYSGNETSYLVDDYYWALNQESLIAEAAASLPSGFYLYTKEHPTNPGYFSFWQLKKLRQQGRIRVLHPSYSSQNLIEHSQAVVVVQGTVGWEALLSQKPVVSLGSSFFSYCPLVYNVKDIRDLPEKILAAVMYGSKIYQDHQEEWLWFIYSVISTAGVGSTVNLQPPYGFATDPKNADQMAEFIFSKILRDLAALQKNASRVI